jgi:hypothetical protein
MQDAVAYNPFNVPENFVPTAIAIHLGKRILWEVG